MKSIEDNCDLLMKQILFSKYILLCLGIKSDTSDNINNFNIEKGKLYFREYSTDELYVNLNNLKGLCICKEKDGINVMNGIYNVIMKLIQSKMIFCDDFLILCSQFVKSMNSKKEKEFLDKLLTCVRECLTKTNERYDDRGLYYFKYYILHSNIWLCKDDDNKLLFDYINNMANESLISQKQYIWENIKKEENKDFENWNNLCNFCVTDKYYDKYGGDNVVLRQDKIENGIKPVKSDRDIYILNAILDEKNKEKTNFDTISEYNNMYITQCIAFANENNSYFYDRIGHLFENKKTSIYKHGNVKKYDRCLVKSNTDYNKRQFPNGACILGMLMSVVKTFVLFILFI